MPWEHTQEEAAAVIQLLKTHWTPLARRLPKVKLLRLLLIVNGVLERYTVPSVMPLQLTSVLVLVQYDYYVALIQIFK
jgi:hypothetical protein